MIQTAKAFVETAGIKEKIKEFKVVSIGTDVAAQLGAIEDFINQGFDAIVTIAVSPEGFDRVIRLADRNGVVIVPFDNILDTDKVMQVNEDQYAMGVRSAEFLIKEMGKSEGKILEVRGVPGNSVDRDRHVGFRETLKAKGGKFEVVEVVGNWDDGTAQKATADALAVHGKFDGVFTQGGSHRHGAGADGRRPSLRPDGGRGRERLPQARSPCTTRTGLKGYSYGQSPALVAISIKAAIAALQGNPMPQLISIPIPEADYTTLKDGENYWSNLTDNFFAANEFPPCGVNIKAPDIMAKSADNVK